MKKIINPWCDHPDYDCFGCSPDNPFGLHLEFYEEGDYIVSKWHPGKHYQGWLHTLHGGIISTLIDETCGWVVTRKMQTSGFTTNLNVKFRQSVSTNEQEVTIRAHIVRQARNLLFIHGTVTNFKGDVCAEGDATYFMLSAEKSKAMGFKECRVEGE